VFRVTGCASPAATVLPVTASRAVSPSCSNTAPGIGGERAVLGQRFEHCERFFVVVGNQLVDCRGFGIEVVTRERRDIGRSERKGGKRRANDKRERESADAASCEFQK